MMQRETDEERESGFLSSGNQERLLRRWHASWGLTNDWDHVIHQPLSIRRAFQAKGTPVLSSWAWSGQGGGGVGWRGSEGGRGQCWVTMGRVVEDDVSVWIFILSVSGKHWRVLSRRTGGTKAEESRVMPKCWHRYWWLLVQCNLAFVPISSSEISANCSITVKIFSPHPPDVLSGICSPSPVFTHGNSLIWFHRIFPLVRLQLVSSQALPTVHPPPCLPKSCFRHSFMWAPKGYPQWFHLFPWINIPQTLLPGSRPTFTAV